MSNYLQTSDRCNYGEDLELKLIRTVFFFSSFFAHHTEGEMLIFTHHLVIVALSDFINDTYRDEDYQLVELIEPIESSNITHSPRGILYH